MAIDFCNEKYKKKTYNTLNSNRIKARYFKSFTNKLKNIYNNSIKHNYIEVMKYKAKIYKKINYDNPVITNLYEHIFDIISIL